ncbi:MAG: hypothetical protein ACRCYU_06625 [Nocardioides sp.]
MTSACSGDAPKSSPPNRSTPSASPEAPELVTRTDLGEIAGRLSTEQRQQVTDAATEAVESYTDWAYLGGDYPRSTWDFPAPGFSKEASDRLRRDVKLATNADIGADIVEVSAVRRRVIVDILAPAGKPAGLTARFGVVFDTKRESADDSRVTVKGRLLLVPQRAGAASKWQVVGHYLTKETA